MDSAVAGGSEAGAPTPARFPQPVTVPGPHGGWMMNDDAQVKHTAEMVQVLAGYGISREYPVEKYASDATLLPIMDGTNETLLIKAAAHL